MMNSMENYYANINGKNEGPFTLEKLKDLVAQKIITPQTYVIPLGSDQWVTAREIQGLFSAGPKLPDPPPLAASAQPEPSTQQPIKIGQPQATGEFALAETPLKFAWTRFTKNPAFYVTFGAITLLVIPIASQLASLIVEAVFAAIGSAGGSYAEVVSLIGQLIGAILFVLISLFAAPFYPAFFSGMQVEASGENCPVSKLFKVGSQFLGSLLIMVACGLIISIGFIFCILPGIILFPLLPISYIYQARGVDAMAAIGKAFNLMKARPLIILHSLGYMSLGFLGILLCCVGQIATFPIAYAAIFKAVGEQDPV